MDKTRQDPNLLWEKVLSYIRIVNKLVGVLFGNHGVCFLEVFKDDEGDCVHTYAIEIDFGLIVFCMFHMEMSKYVVAVVASASGAEDPGSKSGIFVVVVVASVSCA